MQTIANYIDGMECLPRSGQYIDNVEPATGKVYARIPDSDAEDVNAAVDAARRAFPSWSSKSTAERSALLMRLSELIERDLEKLALAESVDTGKPLHLAGSVDIPRAAANFRFFATGILHFASESHVADSSTINYTLRSPIGVVGAISPWNLPLYLFTWKIAPALAAGNTVVGKPSELTPMTAAMLGELCQEAGIPSGVLNIVHGKGKTAGAAIAGHPDISVLTFTGGTATGAEISRAAAGMFKKLSLEMGGKNPTIIFGDASPEEMMTTTLRSSFSNQGQICLCGSRILVEEKFYDAFRKDFVNRTQKLRVGDPLEPENDLGAINSRQHFEKIIASIERAKSEGGKILCGGQPVKLNGRCSDGWFIAPTVIEGLPPACKTNQEEIFGPVVTLMPFEAEEQAVELANSTEYGLAATIWTSDFARAHRVAAKVHSGIVWVNCWMVRDLRTPFGGMKSSGLGREGGWEALRFFTEPKNVCLKI